MINEYIIDKEILLFDYLKEILPNKSKNNIKSLLKNECIYINNKNLMLFLDLFGNISFK